MNLFNIRTIAEDKTFCLVFRLTRELPIEKNVIWNPKLVFLNQLSIEKIDGFGYKGADTYSILYPNRIIMKEMLKITFSCELEFAHFPYDKHECHFSFHEKFYDIGRVIIKAPIKLAHRSQEFIRIKNETMLNLKKLKVPFNIKARINPSTIKTGNN